MSKDTWYELNIFSETTISLFTVPAACLTIVEYKKPCEHIVKKCNKNKEKEKLVNNAVYLFWEN